MNIVGVSGKPIRSTGGFIISVNIGSLVSVSGITAPRVYQRDTRSGGTLGFGTGLVPLLITLSGVPSLEYQLRAADVTGTPVVSAWASLAPPVAGWVSGVNTLSAPLPAGPQRYFLDVAAVGSRSSATLGTTPFGVGEVLAMSGQSLAQSALVENYANNGQSLASTGTVPPVNGYVFAPYCTAAPSDIVWRTIADGTPYNSGFSAELLRLISGQLGVVSALVGHAVGSTSIASWQPGMANYNTLTTVLDQVSRFAAFIWIQGHTEASTGATAAYYTTELNGLFNDLATRYTGPSGGPFVRLISTIPGVIGATANTNFTTVGVTTIRSAAKAWAVADGHARYIDALDSEINPGDGVHPDVVGQVSEARQYFRAFMELIGQRSPRIGPVLVSASRVSGSAIIKLTVAQNGGTNLLAVGTPANQFSVFPAGTMTTPMTVSSFAINSATEVQITLSTAPAGTTALDVWYRITPDTAATVASGIYDNVTEADGLTQGRQLSLRTTALTC